MQKLEYDQAWLDFPAVNELCDVVEPSIRQVAEAFAQNVLRVSYTVKGCSALIDINWQTSRSCLLANLATRQEASANVPKDLSLEEMKLWVSVFTAEMDGYKRARLDEQFDYVKELRARHARMVDEVCDPDPQLVYVGSVLDFLGSKQDGHPQVFAPYVQSIYHSMVVGMWTAFEVMGGDLWEGAVNLHPGTLADIGSDKGRSTDQAKGISLNDLAKLGFDLKNQMGTLLRNKPQISFQTIQNIILAYEKSFSKDAHSVLDAVGHDCFKCLSRLRNSIVHRAARCDTEFKKDAQELEGLAKWKDLEIGDLLIFTGGDVQRLLDPVVEQSVALIKSVAEWIDRH